MPSDFTSAFGHSIRLPAASTYPVMTAEASELQLLHLILSGGFIAIRYYIVHVCAYLNGKCARLAHNSATGAVFAAVRCNRKQRSE
jgi:hypothetical protein